MRDDHIAKYAWFNMKHTGGLKRFYRRQFFTLGPDVILNYTGHSDLTAYIPTYIQRAVLIWKLTFQPIFNGPFWSDSLHSNLYSDSARGKSFTGLVQDHLDCLLHWN